MPKNAAGCFVIWSLSTIFFSEQQLYSVVFVASSSIMADVFRENRRRRNAILCPRRSNKVVALGFEGMLSVSANELDNSFDREIADCRVYQNCSAPLKDQIFHSIDIRKTTASGVVDCPLDFSISK